ncbi:unnamed protein product [Caenorhabditis brenneri]
MGVCISHEYSKPNAQQAEILQDFSKFSKPEERPPMAVEHQMYDYRQAEEELHDELFAIVCCPHSIGFDRDKIALVDLDPSSETFCTTISEIILPSNGDEPGRINWAKSADSLTEMNKLVEHWQSDEMPALLTDMIISMDDRWLYVCGFLHGVIWRFDIQDPFRVTLNGKINIGGVFDSFPEVRIKSSNAMEDRWWLPPETRSFARGTKFRGGPALMQLSKDGCRLYVCNSFYKAWDAQFYPELIS